MPTRWRSACACPSGSERPAAAPTSYLPAIEGGTVGRSVVMGSAGRPDGLPRSPLSWIAICLGRGTLWSAHCVERHWHALNFEQCLYRDSLWRLIPTAPSAPFMMMSSSCGRSCCCRRCVGSVRRRRAVALKRGAARHRSGGIASTPALAERCVSGNWPGLREVTPGEVQRSLMTGLWNGSPNPRRRRQ